MWLFKEPIYEILKKGFPTDFSDENFIIHGRKNQSESFFFIFIINFQNIFTIKMVYFGHYLIVILARQSDRNVSGFNRFRFTVIKLLA